MHSTKSPHNTQDWTDRTRAIYGASDEIAKYPSENPMSPRDLIATMLHAMGVPSAMTLNDLTGRPHHVYGGNPVLPLFG